MSLERTLGLVILVVSLFGTRTEGWEPSFQWTTPLEDGSVASRQGRPTSHRPIASLSGITLITQCAFHCLQDGDICQSFSHQSEGFFCFLYNITINTATMDNNVTFTSYDITHWSIDKVSFISIEYVYALNMFTVYLLYIPIQILKLTAYEKDQSPKKVFGLRQNTNASNNSFIKKIPKVW